MGMYNRTNGHYNRKAATVNRQVSPVFDLSGVEKADHKAEILKIHKIKARCDYIKNDNLIASNLYLRQK